MKLYDDNWLFAFTFMFHSTKCFYDKKIPDRNGVMQYACNIRNANFTNLYLILSKYKICLCVCIKILHIHREYDNEHDDSIYFARANNELIVCVI